MQVCKEHVPKIRFRMCWGSYKFLLMLFGIKNAPLQFIHLVQDILHIYLNDFVIVIVYIDEIMIFFRTTVEHA